jgi:hypothetical protein
MRRPVLHRRRSSLRRQCYLAARGSPVGLCRSSRSREPAPARASHHRAPCRTCDQKRGASCLSPEAGAMAGLPASEDQQHARQMIDRRFSCLSIGGEASWLLFDALLASHFSGSTMQPALHRGRSGCSWEAVLGRRRDDALSENNGHQRQPRRRSAPVSSAIDAQCPRLTSCAADFASRRSPVRSWLAPSNLTVVEPQAGRRLVRLRRGRLRGFPR